jgi:adenine-specific DNA-methyltransferase
MGKNDLNNLGQYFTPNNIARMMCSELLKIVKEGSVLDPCIGKNVFFNNLAKESFELTGVEIDKTLITHETKLFYSQKNRRLIIDDFLKVQFNNKFDGIIVNPPFVRQEKIETETKDTFQKSSIFNQKKFSKKSNLYIYFLYKCLQLLKDEGVMIAITYDSWLYSSFGKDFKNYITTNHYLQKIIHYKNHAFDGVDVGATILIVKKKPEEKDILYVDLESPEDIVNPINFLTITKEELINFNDHLTHQKRISFSPIFFKDLQSYSSITPWRGASSPSNKYFIFNKEKFPFTTPIIKKTFINEYIVNKKGYIYGFIPDEGTLFENHEKILTEIKEEIINKSDQSSLISKIKSGKIWYKFPIKRGGNIIFNYFYRNNTKFVLNPDLVPTMGNFYNIESNKNTYALLALLNSDITRYTFNQYSKNQGRGLKKIQLYQFCHVPILRLDVFNLTEIKLLNTYGKVLCLSSLVKQKNVLEKINSVINNKLSSILSIQKDDLISILLFSSKGKKNNE